MKEVSGSLHAHEGPDEQALDEIVPLRAAGNRPEQGGQMQTVKVPGKPRFPPRSDCVESIDTDQVISY
jgi:hypothetical protein